MCGRPISRKCHSGISLPEILKEKKKNVSRMGETHGRPFTVTREVEDPFS